jgi:hypothetical protein
MTKVGRADRGSWIGSGDGVGVAVAMLLAGWVSLLRGGDEVAMIGGGDVRRSARPVA